MSVMTEPNRIMTSQENNTSVGSQKIISVPAPVLDGKQKVVAFFGVGVICRGEIWYEGTVQIDGQLEGTVHTDGTLLIGKQAQVKATIEAGTVICQGNIYGNIIAKEKINLLSPGLIDGTLTTPKFSVETGGRFNGQVSMNQQSSTRP